MGILSSRAGIRLALLLAPALALPWPVAGQTSAYLDHAGLTREVNSIVAGSELARVESLGTTLGGREIWMVTVGDPSGTPLEERPAVLVVANLEGDQVVGSHLALEAIRHLVRNAGEEAVRAALREHVFYVFPRLNPDGAEAMFARVRWDRRTNAQPFDDDNDGLVDEDGPEDLNGDGSITVMRVADPSGAYMVDPSDARLMKRADPTRGETGTHTLYWEGTDQDEDGFINEDGPGGVDLNRNFQHAYPYWEADAGVHMVSEVESRALMDFVLAHRNIAAILTFGASDNLVTPPDSRGALAAAKVLSLPGFADASNADVFRVGVFAAGASGRGRGGGRGGAGGGVYLRGAQPGRDNDPSSGTRPATTVATQDLVWFTTVSEAYRRITGIESVPLHRTPEGAFFQYGYFQFGVPSFSTPGWALPAPAGTPSQGQEGGARGGGTGQAQARSSAAGPQAAGSSPTDGALLTALEAAGIQAFAEWTAFQHPELGEVEIGGFLPYATSNPPAAQLPALGTKQGEFLVELAGMLPRVRIAETEVKALGGGVFSVSVQVENTGLLPTALRHGQTSRAVGPTFVQIQVDEDDILSGADKTTDLGTLAGSGTRSESVTWLIRGREGARVEIRLHSQKSGRDTATVTLR